ncbi:MAG: glycosyltransferase family 39 protein [Deltaproteobacteria bacterium]|nr:glycosyltransferase family 39 protein [Deltaproteobacteria bacterium]
MTPTLRRVALAAVLLLGVALRLQYVDRPFDHRLLNPWRQSDYLALTRNFAREDANLFYPRIDWRGDTPGYAEMELPLVPWLGAWLWRLHGPAVVGQRALAAALEIGALLLFAALARRVLPEAGALAATLLFALNPLLIVLATSLQPEPLLNLACVAAVLLLWRWLAAPRPATLLAAAALAGLAMLAKLPAAYLGLLFAYAVLRRLGLAALRRPEVWGAALIAALPPLAWYSWAHRFWLVYGNSLGLSNESHLIGADVLWPPTFLLGIGMWETLGVFTPAGLLLAVAALRLPWARIELPVVWYAAVAVFYVLAGRTTGDQWSYYYHSLSVAPAALLMGAGYASFRPFPPLKKGGQGGFPDPGSVSKSPPTPLFQRGEGRPFQKGEQRTEYRWAGTALLAATAGLMLAAGWYLGQRRDHGDAVERQLYECSRALAPLVPADARIVVRGGTKVDEHGHPVAYNASMVFAWMDRKGFNYAAEDFGDATLAAIAARGGRYWLATPEDFAAPGMAAAAARYRKLRDCGERMALFDLQAAPAAGGAG